MSLANFNVIFCGNKNKSKIKRSPNVDDLENCATNLQIKTNNTGRIDDK